KQRIPLLCLSRANAGGNVWIVNLILKIKGKARKGENRVLTQNRTRSRQNGVGPANGISRLDTQV
ncbi:MAG: hypothetical protein ACYSWS_00550, partial [Planctomycetota bacterium]